MSAKSPVVKRCLIAIGLFVVGLSLASCVVPVEPADTQSAAVVAENRDSLQRGMDASAARYTALGEYYAAEKDAIQRRIDASATRYTAMAAYYAAKEKEGIQRGIDASAARYTALAEYYAAKEE